MSYIGTNKVGKMYLGDTAIGKAYLGEDLVYDSAGGETPVLPYDAEIEYLQSSGTQYINTGIYLSSNFKSELKGQYLQNNDNYRPLLGEVDASVSPTRYGNVFCLQSGSSGKLYTQLGSSYTLSNATVLGLHTFVTTLANNSLSLSVDGTSTSVTFSGTLPTFPLVLFGQHRGNEIKDGVNAKIYYCKIWNGGNLVFDAIPVRVGLVGYMYDKVSGQLFGNSGTGSFTLGNDITPIEFIQTTGTQYIDTGLTGNQNTKIEAKFMPCAAGIMYAYGCRGDNSHSITFTCGTNCYLRFGNQAIIHTSSVDTIYEVVQDKTKIRINGVDNTYGAVSDFVTPANIYLMYASYDNSSYYLNGKVYYMKIWSGATLVRDFIPVRVGGVGYLYDKISNKLFGNAGTGSFTLGNDKS